MRTTQTGTFPSYFRRLFPVLVAFALLASLCYPAAAAQNTSTESRSIFVLSIAGDAVTVKKDGKKPFRATENMSLRAGTTISTGADSTVYLQIDEDKVIKLDQNSEAAISQASQKKLSVTLVCGELFFNVKNPIAEGNEFSFRAGNTSMGIRGTSGSIGFADKAVTAMLFTGKAEFVCANESILLTPGIQATARTAGITSKTVPLADITAFALQAVLENTDTIDLAPIGVTEKEIAALRSELPAKKAREDAMRRETEKRKAAHASSSDSTDSRGRSKSSSGSRSSSAAESSSGSRSSSAAESSSSSHSSSAAESSSGSHSSSAAESSSSSGSRPSDFFSLSILTPNVSSGDVLSGQVTLLLEGSERFSFSLRTAQENGSSAQTVNIESKDVYQTGARTISLCPGLNANLNPESPRKLILTLEPTGDLVSAAHVSAVLDASTASFTFLPHNHNETAYNGVFYAEGEREGESYDGQAASVKLKAVMSVRNVGHPRYRVSFNQSGVNLDKEMENGMTAQEVRTFRDAGIEADTSLQDDLFTFEIASVGYTGPVQVVFSADDGIRYTYTLQLQSPAAPPDDNDAPELLLEDKTAYSGSSSRRILPAVSESGGWGAELSLIASLKWDGYALLLEKKNDWTQPPNMNAVIDAVKSAPSNRGKIALQNDGGSVVSFAFSELQVGGEYVLYIVGMAAGAEPVLYTSQFTLAAPVVAFHTIGDSKTAVLNIAFVEKCEVIPPDEISRSVRGEWDPVQGPNSDEQLVSMEQAGIQLTYQIDGAVNALHLSPLPSCPAGRTFSLTVTDWTGETRTYAQAFGKIR